MILEPVSHSQLFISSSSCLFWTIFSLIFTNVSIFFKFRTYVYNTDLKKKQLAGGVKVSYRTSSPPDFWPRKPGPRVTMVELLCLTMEFPG